jgi:hypothetical protein
LPKAGEIVKHIKFILLIILSTFFLFSACSDKNINQEQELKATTIGELYPGNILNVDKIKLVDGSTGYRKNIDQKKEIESILYDIKDIVLQPDKNQEDRVGYVFRIILYEKDTVKMDFIPNAIQGIYYEPNEELYNKLKNIFEKTFERDF